MFQATNAVALTEAPRLKLPQDQVDLMIEAGRDALRESDAFKKFLASLREIDPVAQRRTASPVSAATRAAR